VRLKTATSENSSRENFTARDLSPALVEDLARAVAAAHLRFAGVDLVTPDTSVALAAAGGAIIEVNSPPGIRNHYTVAEPDRANRVAVPVLARLLDEARHRAGPHA
jgi:glutathione synthase/RimK-type ligase-like ATP-grasp enzyme